MRTALCLVLLLLARAVRAEEPPAPPSPEEVVRLLLADDPDERARGEAALIEAVRRDADLAGFVRRLAAALRTLATRDESVPAVAKEAAPPPEPAPAAAPTAPQGPGSGSSAPAAVPMPDPLAEAPQAAPPPAPPTPIPAPAGGAPARATSAPWALRFWTVSVLEREVEGLLPKAGVNTPIVGSRGSDGAQSRHGPAEWAPAWAQSALRSADAQPLGETSLELWPQEPLVRHLGNEVRYRRAAVPSQGGGWAVETAVVRAGLTLAVRLEGASLDLGTTWVQVAQPMATESSRPAPSVGPIELDRPEWSSARRDSQVSIRAQGEAGLLVLPGLLPATDRRLVVVYSLLPR